MDCKLLSIAFLTGFFGDMFLQLLVHNKIGNWGLKDYFSQHGRIESMFIAGGMIMCFYMIYEWTGLPLSWPYLAIYGVLLDLVFRLGNIFPSLEGYYKALNYLESAIWGAIPMIIPLLIYKMF